MSVRLDFRVPKKHKQILDDLAKNLGFRKAKIYREAVLQYVSSYSMIPSLKELDRQVQVIQKNVDEIKKALLKKGVLE